MLGRIGGRGREGVRQQTVSPGEGETGSSKITHRQRLQPSGSFCVVLLYFIYKTQIRRLNYQVFEVGNYRGLVVGVMNRMEKIIVTTSWSAGRD